MPALFCNGTILESKQYTGYKVLKLIMQRNQSIDKCIIEIHWILYENPIKVQRNYLIKCNFHIHAWHQGTVCIIWKVVPI